MRTLITACLFLVLAACTSVVQIPELDRTVTRSQQQIRQTTRAISAEYQISHAQFLTVASRAKGQNLSSLNQLNDEFNQLTKLTREYEKRSAELYKASATSQKTWKGKAQITSNDPEWESLKKFNDLFETESQALSSIRAQIKSTQLAFKGTLKQQELAPFIARLPQYQHQARGIIAKYEQEQAYARYNLQLLDELAANAKSTNRDFESLAKLAQFSTPAQHRASRPPRGYPGPDQETLKKASKIISAVVNPAIVAAAEQFATKQKPSNDISKTLAPLKRGRFSYLTSYTSPENTRAIDKLFADRKTDILREIVATNSTKQKKILASSNTERHKLRNLVSLRKEFGTSYQALLNEPIIQAHLRELQQQRLGLLASISPQLISSINASKTLTNFNNPLPELTVPEDNKTVVAQKIKSAWSKKLNALLAFKPAKNESELSINSFTSRGLNYETELLAIYLGDFKHARLERNSTSLSALYGKYLSAYGTHCHVYLPSNKVAITKTECATERVTRNGWGTVTDTTCVKWVEIPTGLYADPTLYYSHSRHSKSAGLRMAGQILNFSDPYASRSLVDDLLSIGDDMSKLVTKNRCDNAGLNRFETNLYNFVEGNPPLLLPGKETIATIQRVDKINFNTDNLNLKKLIDELIKENSKGWMMNRYQSGSVSSLKIGARNRDGSPRHVTASYAFSSMGKTYGGNVSLDFSNGIPNCLYFSDAPQTCRHPSRRIVNRYEKGLYSQ